MLFESMNQLIGSGDEEVLLRILSATAQVLHFLEGNWTQPRGR
jgi:hypothetical protein